MAKHFTVQTITNAINLFSPLGTLTIAPEGVFLNSELIDMGALTALVEKHRGRKAREAKVAFLVNGAGPMGYAEAKEIILVDAGMDRKRLEDKEIRAMTFLARLNALSEGNHLIKQVEVGASVEDEVPDLEDEPEEVVAKAPREPDPAPVVVEAPARTVPVKAAKPKAKAKPAKPVAKKAKTVKAPKK